MKQFSRYLPAGGQLVWICVVVGLLLGTVAAIAGGPPIISFGMEESGNRNPRAFRPSEALDLFMFTTDSAGNNARATFVATSDGSRTDFALPYRGGNLYQSTSSATSIGLPDGFYDVEYTLCDGSFPSSCTDSGTCTCRVLPTSPSRLWIDSETADLTAATIDVIRPSGEVEPNRTTLVFTASDSFDVRVTSAAYDPADSCIFFVDEPTFITTLSYLGGDQYRSLVRIPTAALADGYHNTFIDLKDGLARDRAMRFFKFDNHTPDAPTVTAANSAPAGFPLSVGDTIIVSATCSDSSEDTLLTRFGIDVVTGSGTIALVEQANAVSAEHTASETIDYTYVIPASAADGGGFAGTVEMWSTVSDGGLRSANAMASVQFDIDTTPPDISEVRVEVNDTADDCFGVGSVLDFEVFGTADVRVASIDLVRPDGTAWLSDLPLAWNTFRYVGSRVIAQADVDDAPFSVDGEAFTLRARIGHSDALLSDPVDSRTLTFFSAALSTPAVESVGSVPTWALTAGEIAVDDAASVSIGGSGTPNTDIVAAAVGGGGSVTVARVASDGTWSGTINLNALGIDLTDASPDQLALTSTECGAESPAAVFDLRLDDTSPSTPNILPTMPAAAAADTVRATATDDASLVGRLEVCTGNPNGGGLLCTETDMDESVSGGVTTFTSVVPASQFTRYGARYRVMVSDGVHVSESTTAPAIAGTGADTDQAGSVFENVGIAPGVWHLVSLPTELNNTDSATLFPTLGSPRRPTWGMFEWRPAFESGQDGGEYASNLDEAIAVTPGEAVWFKWFRPDGVTSARFTFTGDATPLNAYALELEPGWNQIGSPFAFDVSWPSDAPILRRFANDVYTGGAITRMEPFVGYFVFSEAAETILLDPEAAITLDPPARHPQGFAADDPRGWALQLIAGNGVWEDPDNYAAVHPAGEAGRDALDLGEFLRPEAAPRLEFEPESGDRLSADVRSADVAVHRWNLSVVVPFTSTTADVYVRWRGVDEVPESVSFRVRDGRTGRVVDPRMVPELRITAVAGERYPLELVAGAEADLDLSVLPPNRLALLPAFPNPLRVTDFASNAGVRLGYEVPAAGMGAVTVFDVVGRLVRRHVITHGAPGPYSVTWDGRDGRGARAASGVYVIEIEFGGERRGQKLVVLPR